MTVNRFNSVLIANRGVIAQRIARTCKEKDLAVIMVYAPDDKHLPLLTLADRVFCCDYRDINALITLAKTQQAAIHPGYGFLAESDVFARACEKAGVPFIGPSAEVLALTGQKQAALKRVQQQGVPCLPHHYLTSETFKALQSPADTASFLVGLSLDFPVMVKPCAAGGGVGLQEAHGMPSLIRALHNAQSLGQSLYGSGDILIEKALHQVQHIEVQLLADSYGNRQILGDRHCSLQRRRQKVVEEGPAPLQAAQRQRLYTQANTIAECLGIDQVSTLEFLWDGNDFWFLEANPRLQVEHGITELLFPVDLVACQIDIAQGKNIFELHTHSSLATEKEPLATGHAIEVRLYAEDPQTGLPTAGQVVDIQLPTGHGLRIESSLYAGMKVSANYDPLLMKILAHGTHREQCRKRLLNALRTTVIQGDAHLQTNQQRLIDTLESAAFKAGDYTTESFESQIDEQIDEQRCEPKEEAVSFFLEQALKTAVIQTQNSPAALPTLPPPSAAPHAQNWSPDHWS